jgi:hypothetical protein
LGNFELKREDNDLLEFDPDKCPIRKGTDVILTKEPEEEDCPWDNETIACNQKNTTENNREK